MIDEKTFKERSIKRFVEETIKQIKSVDGIELSPVTFELNVVSMKGKDEKIYDVIPLAGEYIADKRTVRRVIFALEAK